MALWLGGNGVSRGICIGPVRVLHELQIRMQLREVRASQVGAEVRRFRNAVRRTVRELRRVHDRVAEHFPKEAASYLESQVQMLEDKSLVDPVISYIREQHQAAEWALAMHRDHLLGLFEEIDDPYLKVRGGDIENVIGRIMRQLHGPSPEAPAAHPPESGYVLLSSDLAPADLLLHRRDGMRGVLTEHGSALSHTTILARSIGVPMVVGLGGATGVLREGETLILDGDMGMVIADPDRRTVKHYRQRQRSEAARQRALRKLRKARAVTLDGESITLLANIECAEDATLARRNGADGIGLLRTETLYQNRTDLPDEEEHFNLLRGVQKRMPGRPVTVRTMDLWASREVPGLARILPNSAQPAMGLRAIRLCLRHPEVFEPQLRGLMRAAAHGEVRILLPMISSVDEVRETRALMDRLGADLQKQTGKSLPAPQLGVMIEVPAAAIACGMFLRHVDFFSIGTNDLAQYTLAADRNDDQMQALYDPLHPALLVLIRDTIRRASRAGVSVSVCGEMAGDADMTRLLLGLGLREFSMHPARLLEVKDRICHSNASELARPAGRLLRASSREKSSRLLASMNMKAASPVASG